MIISNIYTASSCNKPYTTKILHEMNQYNKKRVVIIRLILRKSIKDKDNSYEA